MAPPITYQARKAVASLNAATANGDGGGANVSGYRTIAMQVIEGGTVSTGTVTLELSLNGEDWHTTATVYDASSDTSGEMFWSTDTPANYARAVLASITGGGNITALISGA